ncbi:MAG: hypothetical protein DHS20C10_02310 [marine bacterium B5-7]|nr:MAG: hypothetical protein DHS20C10_02310 [marine bacterium B5-7]
MSAITKLKRYVWEGPGMTALKSVYHSSFAYSTNKKRFQAHFSKNKTEQQSKIPGILNTLAIIFILLCLGTGVFGLLASAGGAPLGLSLLAGLLFGGGLGVALATGSMLRNWGTTSSQQDRAHTLEEQSEAPATAVLIASMPFLLVAAVVMFTVDILGGSALKMCFMPDVEQGQQDASASKPQPYYGQQMQSLGQGGEQTVDTHTDDTLPVHHDSSVSGVEGSVTDTANNTKTNILH